MAFDYNEYIKRTRKAESGGNDNAKNSKSSASGRYQFVKGTWEGLGFNWADRFDPNKQEQAMQKFTMQNINTLSKQLNREPSYGDAYGAHFLGVQGYLDLVRANPSSPVSSVFSDSVIRANASVMRNKTVGEVLNFINKKAGVESATFENAPTQQLSIKEPEQQVLKPQMGQLESLPQMEVKTEAEIAKDEIKYVQATEDLAQRQVVQEAPHLVQPQPEYNYLQDTNLFTL